MQNNEALHSYLSVRLPSNPAIVSKVVCCSIVGSFESPPIAKMTILPFQLSTNGIKSHRFMMFHNDKILINISSILIKDLNICCYASNIIFFVLPEFSSFLIWLASFSPFVSWIRDVRFEGFDAFLLSLNNKIRFIYIQNKQ